MLALFDVRMWSTVRLSGWRSCGSSTHSVVRFGGVAHCQIHCVLMDRS